MESKYKKIYVFAPHNHATGGVELAHQLVDYLRTLQINAFIVYIEKNKIVSTPIIRNEYRRYNLETSSHIDDNDSNMIVLPETMTHFARFFKKINVACWWMSVDNFTKTHLGSYPLLWNKNKNIYGNLKRNIHLLISRLPLSDINILAFFRKEKNRTIHLYQSEYANKYIIKNRLGKSLKLSDYINPELFPISDVDLQKKQDIVLYNPAKGYEFTQKIISACSNVKFIPLKGFSREELNKLFDIAKLYIDFGHFPGKDRLPREAVLHHCCIITGKLGAAKYYEDVPIDNMFKFDAIEEKLMDIVCKINEVLNNYDEYDKLFENYRLIVKNEQIQFYKETEKIFTK